MISPSILPRVEQWDMLAVKVAGDIGAFVRITAFTAQREILGDGHAAVFFSDDMIDLEREEGNICRNLAILTAPNCPLPDELL